MNFKSIQTTFLTVFILLFIFTDASDDLSNLATDLGQETTRFVV